MIFYVLLSMGNMWESGYLKDKFKEGEVIILWMLG